MKITLAYLPEEEREAAADLAMLLRFHPDAKVRKSTAHPPKLCVYLTTRNPPKPCDSKGKP